MKNNITLKRKVKKIHSQFPKRYIILLDTCGDGLETFSFGCYIHEEGKELESGLYHAFLEWAQIDDLNDLENDTDCIDSFLSCVVLCEVSDYLPKMKLSKETVTNIKLDIF